MRFILVAVSAVALAACTHLETSRDYGSGSLDTAVPGIPYALPAVQFDLAIVHSVNACPQSHSLPDSGVEFVFSDSGLKIATTVESSPDYVAGEQFLADYRALSSFVKTSGYGLKTYPNGVLKSLNASAEDQTANLIKDVVSVGLSIAKLSSGVPSLNEASASSGPNLLAAYGDLRGFDQANAALLIKERPPAPAQLSTLRAAIATLKSEAGTSTYLACRSGIARDQTALNAKVELLKDAVKKLAASSALVSRMTLITANAHANREDLVRLEKALADQVVDDVAVQLLLAEVNKVKKALTVTDDQVVRIKDSVVSVVPSDPGAFHRLLVIEQGPVVSAERFAKWWLKLSPSLRAEFRSRFPLIAKAYGVTDRDPDMDRWVDSKSTECSGLSISACILPAVTIHALLSSTDRPETAPDRRMLVRPMTDVRSPGLFIRSQQKADFRLCVGHSNVLKCPSDKLLLLEREIAAPQLGQLRFLPFSSRAFESAKLSLLLRENGSIEEFEYGVTKSMSSGSAAVKDALDQYSKHRDEQDAKAKATLQAQRVEQLAVLEHQIALKTKQQALTTLNEPTEADPLAEINAQTAVIQAEVALLNAQLSRKTAEAALLGSGGQ